LRQIIGTISGVVIVGEQNSGKCACCFFFAATLRANKEICVHGLQHGVAQECNGAVLATHEIPH
jgi:hypothetical protein